MSRRRAFAESPVFEPTCLSSIGTTPASGSIRRIRSLAVVDLPQPDSPTMPRVSPRRTVKDTSSTAWTAATCRWNRPPRIGKCFTRPRTSMIAGALLGVEGAAFGGCSRFTASTTLRARSHPDVHRVPKAVAQHVEGHRGDEDHHSGDYGHPRADED